MRIEAWQIFVRDPRRRKEKWQLEWRRKSLLKSVGKDICWAGAMCCSDINTWCPGYWSGLADDLGRREGQ